MKQKLVSESKNTSNGAGRKTRLHGRVVSKEELHQYVLKNAIHKGITGTKKISEIIGKKERQTKRILDDMAFDGLIEQDAITGRIVKTQKQQSIEFHENLFRDKFRKIPEIKTFIEKAEKRGVKPRTLATYLCALKAIFTKMKTHPASVIVSQQSAEEFFENYTLEIRKENPERKDASHPHRVAYRVFLASVANISYGHGMAGSFGSHHDSYQKYKKAHIPVDVFKDLSKMMLEDKEYRLYTWFNTGVMTGARTGGIASMTWERVNLYLDDFKLEQFETKDDSAGHVHLGQRGEWKEKHPPAELYHILKDWKENHAPKNSKFVWIEDAGKDITNLRRIETVRKEVIPKLKEYLAKPEIKSRLSPITIEYIFVAGEAGHINRHTFAQLMRNNGASKSQIAYAGGWKKEETLDWYCDISEEEKQESKKLVSSSFGGSN